MTGYDGRTIHHYPDKSFDIVLILLREIEPFTPEQVRVHLEVQNIKLIKNLLEEMIRRKMIINTRGRGAPIPEYRLSRVAIMYLPPDISRAYIPVKDRPKCIFELRSPKLNKFLGRFVTSQEITN